MRFFSSFSNRVKCALPAVVRFDMTRHEFHSALFTFHLNLVGSQSFISRWRALVQTVNSAGFLICASGSPPTYLENLWASGIRLDGKTGLFWFGIWQQDINVDFNQCFESRSKFQALGNFFQFILVSLDSSTPKHPEQQVTAYARPQSIFHVFGGEDTLTEI